MVKLMGSALVLGGGALCWWTALNRRRRVRQILRDLTAALRRMGEEIRMARTPLPLLLEVLAEDCRSGEAAVLFRQTAEKARLDGPLGPVWQAEVRRLPLEPRELAALEELPLRGDEEHICKAISLVCDRLEESAEARDRQRQEQDRRTAALCFSGAALLVILLI
jgi:hypothetical protein